MSVFAWIIEGKITGAGRTREEAEASGVEVAYLNHAFSPGGDVALVKTPPSVDFIEAVRRAATFEEYVSRSAEADLLLLDALRVELQIPAPPEPIHSPPPAVTAPPPAPAAPTVQPTPPEPLEAGVVIDVGAAPTVGLATTTVTTLVPAYPELQPLPPGGPPPPTTPPPPQVAAPGPPEPRLDPPSALAPPPPAPPPAPTPPVTPVAALEPANGTATPTAAVPATTPIPPGVTP